MCIRDSPVICAGSPAVAGSRGSICIDMRPGYRIAFRRLPENTIYLDMTSEAEKERLLCAKRKDISYVSALNILDTYVRKRYNTNRDVYKRQRPTRLWQVPQMWEPPPISDEQAAGKALLSAIMYSGRGCFVYRAVATAQAGHEQGVNSNGTAALRPSA